MTRLLLAGTGLIGQRHLDHIRAHPRLTLAGIIDPVEAARTVPDAPGFDSIEAVDVEADGIILATPTATHVPLAIAAAARGWHILVEKPLADSLDAADRMIEATEGAGIHVLVGHHRRHHPQVQALKEILEAGRIGRPLVATLLWCMRKPDSYFDLDWRKGPEGGPVMQNLIHDVDLLRGWFGEVATVQGTGSNAVRGARRTESGGAILTFDSGVICTIAFSDATPSPWGFEAGTGENPNIAATGADTFFIAGTQGAVSFPSLQVWSGSDTWAQAPAMTPTRRAEGTPLIRQLEHFAEVIAGRAPPLVNARSARATLAAILEIEAACFPK